MRPFESVIGAVLVGVAVAAPQPARAQIDDSVRGEASAANHFIETPRRWRHPLTPWGEPDIRATLDMMQAAGVPLERCATSYRFGNPPCDMDKAWLSDEEYETRMQDHRNTIDRSVQLAQEGDLGGAILAGMMDPSIPQRQTNLIVDPPNGLLPPLTPAARRLAREYGSDWSLPGEDLTFDGPDDFDSWDRCITRGMPSMMMPYRYNGGFRIHQSPGVVVLETEMIHEARVVSTDGRSRLSPAIGQWLGDSRGRWEGTTLVVETTNYRNGIEINNPLMNLAVVGSPPGNRFPASARMRTTERIVRLNDDWWLYEITTEDPVVLTRPFTVRYPMRNDPDYLWPEYACHEDNAIVRNYTETSRYERANPAPEPAQRPVAIEPGLAAMLAGRWIGRPRIVTIDVDVELEFIVNSDGAVNGRLIGTSLGEIDKPLRELTIEDRVMRFTLPNTSPWSFGGEITGDGTIVGVLNSAQGGVPVTFRLSSRR